MMEDILISSEGRFCTVNAEKQTLRFYGRGYDREFSFSSFLRFSRTRPWDFPLQQYDIFSVSKQADSLAVTIGSNELSAEIVFRFTRGILKCSLEVFFHRESSVNHVAVAVPITSDAILTLPGVLYNNNPAVAEVDTVAHFPPTGSGSLIVEESRLPITGVNAEKNGSSISLFSVPDNRKEWTLGPHRNTAGETFLMLTDGCLSFNGVKDRIYSAKRAVSDNCGTCNNFAAGQKISKDFVLSWGETAHCGHGFRDLVLSGFKILQPAEHGILTRQEVIDLKMSALKERWAGDGYICAMPDNIYGIKPYFLYGWVGQSFRLALCDLLNALNRKEREGIERMYKCVDFFLKNSKTDIPGLRYNYFHLEDSSWTGEGSGDKQCFSARSLGETWTDLARIIRCCRENGLAEPEGALEALREGLQFIIDHRLECGAVPFMWFADGTPISEEVSCAGSSVLPAFLEYYRLTGEERWCRYAEDMLDIFYKTGAGDFKTPFSHATLDAACEDKEAAVPFFIASAAAYELTGREKFRRYAEIAADWLLTWVYFHDVPLRQDSICYKNGFRTTGWPTVSVEHHHLDVFFPARELYEFGKATDNDLYRKMGKIIFAAWSHGISQGRTHWFFSNQGRQAEQFFQTDWFFVKDGREHWDIYTPALRYQLKRAGYTEENLAERQHRGGCTPWDVSWIIALVLDAALGFETED